MLKVKVKEFGVSCGSYFDVPKPFSSAVAEKFVCEAFAQFKVFGLKAENFRRFDGDGMFRYQIAFSLFNGRAIFELDGEKLQTSITGGNSQKDATLILDLLRKAASCGPGTAFQLFNAHCHVEIDGSISATDYLTQFRGARAGVQVSSVSFELNNSVSALLQPYERTQLEIEPSQVIDNGLFLNWRLNARGGLTEEFLSSIEPRIKEITTGVEIEMTL